MQTETLRAFGRSVWAMLPRPMLRTLGLAAGALVAMTGENGWRVVSPARPRCTLDELLAGMKPGVVPTTPGWADAPNVGREVWCAGG